MTIYFSNITFMLLLRDWIFFSFFLKNRLKSKFIHLFSHLWRIPETLHWYKLSSYENCFAWQFFPLFQPTVWTANKRWENRFFGAASWIYLTQWFENNETFLVDFLTQCDFDKYYLEHWLAMIPKVLVQPGEPHLE